jgi:hypothetical protein
MNMGFQKPHGTELQFMRSPSRELPPYLAFNTSSAPRRGPLKYLLLTVAGVGVGYAAIHASATILFAAAGGLIALVAIATAIGIYVQNNSPF